MSDLDRAVLRALEKYVNQRAERGKPVPMDQFVKATRFLSDLLPVATRHGISEHGIELHLVRASLDAVLAPPRKPPRKQRLRQAKLKRTGEEPMRTT